MANQLLDVSKNLRIPALEHNESRRPRHCKIIGTLGPSSADPEVMRGLIEAGLNIVRLNFSHGDHEDHLRNIENIRRIAKETGNTVALLQDLQGPKIRCGKLIGNQMNVITGNTYQLAFGEVQTDPSVIPIDYADLVYDTAVGHRVMMDDGLLIFQITAIEDQVVHVVATDGGLLKNRKGVNFPDSVLSLPALTEKDSRDLLFGLKHRVDFVALSFVQRPEDIKQVKTMIQAMGSDVPVIAKIEKISAIQQIDEIAKVSDALMVARGDLGVEASVEKVPGFQREIIAAASRYAKPVIIATQMLESMIKNPRASLAEVADVANGVLDGADCLMLSGEVAAGKYPIECVKKMASIIEEIEAWTMKRPRRYETIQTSGVSQSWPDHEAIGIAACEAADSVGAKAILCLTLTGNIAKTIAKWRPKVPVIAISPRAEVIQRLMLVWGVYGLPNPLFYKTDELLQDLPELIKALKIVDSGDIVVITAGIPISKMSATNMVKINRIP
jgi:pyruvate kinase